jgi:hypothetical protein
MQSLEERKPRVSRSQPLFSFSYGCDEKTAVDGADFCGKSSTRATTTVVNGVEVILGVAAATDDDEDTSDAAGGVPYSG